MTKRKKQPEPKLEGSVYDDSKDSPGLLFWNAYHLWTRKMRDGLEITGLTQPQYSILAATSYLTSTGEVVSQQSVATQLSMDKMMVSDVVKTLETKKLIVRKRHPVDGRSVSLHLTSEARNRLKVAVPIVEKTDEEFFGRLKPEQKKLFMACLAQICEPS